MDIILNGRIITVTPETEHQEAVEKLQRQLRIAEAENNVLRKKLNSISSLANF